MDRFALLVSIKGVVKGGAVIPFQIVRLLSELVLDNVEIAAIRPVVPEVRHLEAAAAVDDED